MIKNYRKILCAGICFFVFLYIAFFSLSINRVSALTLEVAYPTISGQNINIEAKEAKLTLPSYVKYLFNAGMFLGFFAVFISLTIAGVMYFLSPVSPDFLSESKDRVGGAISGLLILALTYLIITTINPQLSVFNLNKLPSMACDSSTPPKCVSGGTGASCITDDDCAPKKTPGVYFYKPANCPDNSVEPNTSSIPDLGDALRNHVNSVGIVQSSDAYLTILYNNINFWGQCQYVTNANPENPQSCQNVTPFASSASIYRYDFHPENNNPPIDGGVYFYRKSCFNNPPNYNASTLIAQCKANSGGWYKIGNSTIASAKIVIAKLDDLCFTGADGPNCSSMSPDDCTVSKDEQNCVKYDKNGKCCTGQDADLGCDGDGRECPSLGGENISSMIINGNYLVLFVYLAPGGPWTSCQEFPTPDDVNKIGPHQIKWENIRNSYKGVIPDWVIIIPIQK